MDEGPATALRWIAKFWLFVRLPHVAPIAASVVLGPLLGVLAYVVTSRGGMLPFVTVFTGAALLIGLIASVLQRRTAGLVLRDITISIPEFSSWSFVVNDEHKRVAWRLFVETASRVATQPLTEGQGVLREALTSLYSLFATTREALKTMDPSRAGRKASVEIFALGMLNNELRPFLSKWHALLSFAESADSFEESEWERADECRAGLEAMRVQLLAYCRAFGELAGIQDVDAFLVGGTRPQSPT